MVRWAGDGTLESSFASPVPCLAARQAERIGASYPLRELCTEMNRMCPETQVSPALTLESIPKGARQIVTTL
jgi:hypothetical protein